MKLKNKKIWQVLFYITAILLLLISLLFIGAKVPGVGNYQVLTVLGGSMEPTIDVGSVIVISPAQKYNEKDIITFREGDSIPTTHRIVNRKVEKGEQIYITQGDANPTEDLAEIKKEQIMGKVDFSIPYLGYGVGFVKSSVGFFLLIILPAILIISREIKNIYRELKKKEQ